MPIKANKRKFPQTGFMNISWLNVVNWRSIIYSFLILVITKENCLLIFEKKIIVNIWKENEELWYYDIILQILCTL